MTLTIEQINACCATAKLLLAAGKNLADPSLKPAFQEIDELARYARIGASVMPRPIEEADKKGVVPLLLFGGTFTWDTSSYDPGWMPFTGLAMTTKFDGPMDAWCGDQCEGHDQYYWHRPTHFIPLSALPKPAEVTT